ncbi:tripartite motif-containing protein 16-like isoform X1 [Astyanax mexicanus]|uniref:tripartite motif-containing protein 16-like isoform X1 n=1 Tax=Astyanax mexicanus TaxID=7994 RepID=UPI0020CB0DBB|nr:tripartite motif-containing protein 16-like isoform X1 [Astyanax mexicanus]
MAEAGILSDQDEFCCSVCLDVLKNPVTVPCGHTFCMVCINNCWDQEDQRGIYSCPQCNETFTPRPVLYRSYIVDQILEKLKKTDLPAASPAGSGKVECDVCTGRKLRAVKSCLTCLASFCETHLKPHYEAPALNKHKLVKASKQLQEKICSQHDKPIEIYCRTDNSPICYMCTMHEHKGHDTVAAEAERTQKQSEIKEIQEKLQRKLQRKEKKLQELKTEINTLKISAQAAVEDSEKIFTEMIRSIEKKRSEVMELIRDQEETGLSEAEELLEKLEQQISDLKRKNTELNQLSQTEDHISFLQSFQTLRVSSEPEDSSSISIHHQLSLDGVKKSLTDLKDRLEQFYNWEFSVVPAQSSTVGVLQTVSAPEPKTRSDFLQYFCQLHLDPNTLHHYLSLSENKRKVWLKQSEDRYPDHPERFDYRTQVMSKESVCGRAYWEVNWSGKSAGSSSVSYKGISRKGGDESMFGRNDQSWSLEHSYVYYDSFSSYYRASFWHNNIETKLPFKSSSYRVGVYVDHSAGTLSFYNISNTVTLIHTVQTTFTQPLYAGFRFGSGSSVKLCDLVEIRSEIK